MEKPDLMQVSASLQGMVTCMPLVGGERQKRDYKRVEALCTL